MKQIPINLCQGVGCTIRHNPGVMSPSNVLTPPLSAQIRTDLLYGCLTAHYHKISPRNIFGGFREQAIISVMDKLPPPKLRYVLGRTNAGGKGQGNHTLSFHVNPYFGCVAASKFANRETWIVEIQSNLPT